MLGKGFSLQELGVDFCVRRHADRGSSCPSPHTCLTSTHHHCSLLLAGQGSSQQRTHTPLPGANEVPRESREPTPQLCAPPVAAPVGWKPQPHRLPKSQEKSPKDLRGGLGHEMPGDGSWPVLLCFIWARGCSAQKGKNDSYSSPLIIWDPTFNICKYICVPALHPPLSWRNS